VRAVVSHFFNEEYLLPWWLRHHTALFDFGVMIDHGSTDRSVEVVRELAPHWRLVKSQLYEFDAYRTDLEVMHYEQELPPGCWKIALTTTEFLMPAIPLNTLESVLEQKGLRGCSTTGINLVDTEPSIEPTYDQSLPIQKHTGFFEDPEKSPAKMRYLSRFYHRNSVGMYHPGRHRSFDSHASIVTSELPLFKYAASPWSEAGIARKLQIASRVPQADVERGMGAEHRRTKEQLQDYRQGLLSRITPISSDPNVRAALQGCVERW